MSGMDPREERIEELRLAITARLMRACPDPRDASALAGGVEELVQFALEAAPSEQPPDAGGRSEELIALLEEAAGLLRFDPSHDLQAAARRLERALSAQPPDTT